MRRQRSTSPISTGRLQREARAKTCCAPPSLQSPQDAGFHHALGLALARLKRPDEALAELRRAVELEPERARYAYVYAVALNSAGRGDEAMTVLKESSGAPSGDRDTLSALISFSRDARDFQAALGFAERLAVIAPGDISLRALINNLQRQINNPDAR